MVKKKDRYKMMAAKLKFVEQQEDYLTKARAILRYKKEHPIKYFFKDLFNGLFGGLIKLLKDDIFHFFLITAGGIISFSFIFIWLDKNVSTSIAVLFGCLPMIILITVLNLRR